MAVSAFNEQKDAATSAGDEAFTRPSGFASFARELRGDLDKIAADATDTDERVVHALAELSEAVGKMAATVEDTTRLLMEAAEDITRHLMEAIDKENAATGAASGEAVSGAGGVELEEHAVDGDAYLDDRVQQEMYYEEEEAFLDQLDYREMVLDVDEALDDLRLEAAGCSGDPPPTTAFLGRYGFFTLQDFLKLVD